MTRTGNESSAVAVASIFDLSEGQREFIAIYGPDPKDPNFDEYISEFLKTFDRQFGVRLDWATLRRLVTNIKRRYRREGNGIGFFKRPDKGKRRRKTSPRCVRRPAAYRK